MKPKLLVLLLAAGVAALAAAGVPTKAASVSHGATPSAPPPNNACRADSPSSVHWSTAGTGDAWREAYCTGRFLPKESGLDGETTGSPFKPGSGDAKSAKETALQ
jgi:hypothetical protein